MKQATFILIIVLSSNYLLSQPGSEKVLKMQSPYCKLEVKEKGSDEFITQSLKMRHLVVLDFIKNKINVYDDKMIYDLDILNIERKDMESYIPYKIKCVDQMNNECIATFTLYKKDETPFFLQIDHGFKRITFFLDK